jgi:hypothetical protein
MQNELTAERIELAIKEIADVGMYGSQVHQETMETALAALRTEQERQWISVKDRLPDMCGCKCLVVGANRFGQVDVFTAFTGYMERGKLEFHSCEPTHEIPVWTVTHWMPLPAPPAPAADVSEVVHGEWLYFVGDYVTAECSVCGECYDPLDYNDKEHFDMFKQLYKYCPNCGAKMDGDHIGDATKMMDGEKEGV